MVARLLCAVFGHRWQMRQLVTITDGWADPMPIFCWRCGRSQWWQAIAPLRATTLAALGEDAAAAEGGAS